MSPVCAVCGIGGYWVAFNPGTGDVRCVNHINNVNPEVPRG